MKIAVDFNISQTTRRRSTDGAITIEIVVVGGFLTVVGGGTRVVHGTGAVDTGGGDFGRPEIFAG